MSRVAIAMLASMFLLLAPASTAVEESAVFTVGDKWAFGKEIDLMEEASSVISELENNITELMSSEEAEMLKNATGLELKSFVLDNEAILGFYYTGEVVDDFDQMIHMQTEQSLYSHTVLGTKFTSMFPKEGTHELRLECTGSEEDPDCKLLDNTTGEQLDLEELTTEIGGSMHYVAKVTQDTWWTQDTHELAKTEITFALGAAGEITIRNVPNLTFDGVSILDMGEGEDPSFVCGDGEEVPFDWVNDGYEDCSDGSDEQQYDSDGDRINWFDCHDGSKVWVDQVNDGVDDCPDGEDEGYGDDYYDDFGPSEAHIDVHMIDLANWEAYATGTFDPMWPDDMRAEIAHKCAEMMGTSDTEITSECFDEWVAMTEDGPGGGEPDRGCPHDMDEDTCDDFREACGPDSLSKLTCFRMIFDYCDDHDDEMCHEGIASEDEGGEIIKALFAYEDEEIGSEEFLEILEKAYFGGGGAPALYDTYTFTITTDDEGIYSLHPDFGSHSEGGHDFICGNGDEIPFHYVNDGYGDCPDGADEQWYDSGTPGDTSDDCQMWNDADCDGAFVNWFDCHDGSEIWIVAVNNGEDNCPYGEDEAYDGSDGSDYWYGYVFLYTGNFTDVPDSTENIIGAAVEVCGYEDEANKAGVH